VRVIWTPEAEHDRAEVWNYISNDNPHAAATKVPRIRIIQLEEDLWEGCLAPITHRGVSTTIATANSVIAARARLPQKQLHAHRQDCHHFACGGAQPVGGAPRPDYAPPHIDDIATSNSVIAASTLAGYKGGAPTEKSTTSGKH
jgi:hypothetical protein